MSLLDLYADRIDQSIQRDLLRPPPGTGEQSFSTWSFAAAGVKGVPRGGLQGTAAITDLLSGFGTAAAAAGGGRDLFGGEIVPGAAQQEEEARKKMLEGHAFDFGMGNELRRKANEFAPPETAHRADQVINGVTSGLTKAATAITVAGPVAGSAIFGAEEANTTYHELREKGIDHETALKVSGVIGTISGATAGVPAGGSTVLRSLGIATAAGPASFVAQESAARKILADAGYKDEASLHNPTDPLGLVLSTVIPFGAAGLHVRGLAKVKSEADVKAAVQMNPAEQARSDAFERSAANIQELQAAIAAEKRPDAKAALEAELATQQAEARKHAGDAALKYAADDPAVVDAARVHVTNDALQRSLPEAEGSLGEVMRAADEVAAGRMPRDMEPAYAPPRIDDEYIARLPEGGPRERMVELYAQAAREKPGFDATIKSIADDLGAEVKLGELKGTQRAVEKVESDYGGDPSKIKDLLRATIKVDTAEDAQRAVAGIFERFEVLPTGRRNNLDPTKQPIDGYRDAKFNVVVNGHVAEVQVNVPQMLAAKKEVHPLYVEREAITRAAQDAGHELLPPDVAAKIDDLNARMRAAYDQAWAEATKSRNSASEISAPLRYMDSTGKERGSAASQATAREGLTPAPRETGIPSTSKNLAEGGNWAGRDGFITTSEAILPKPGEEGPLVTKRADALLEASPDLKVRLPGSEETLTVKEALQRAREEAARESSEAGLVEAAMKCVLG